MPESLKTVPITTKIVGFLQNQWFADPVRVRQIYERHGQDLGDRADLNARFLFAGGGMTGLRLRKAFGGDLCDAMVWENASPRLGGKSSDCFPADPAHIAAVIDFHRPSMLVIFGRVARELAGVPIAREIVRIYAPHPAARGTEHHLHLLRSAAATRRALGLPPLRRPMLPELDEAAEGLRHGLFA